MSNTQRSNRSSNKARRELDIVRRREKEFSHQKYWGDQEKYFKHWEKKNTKFEEWTSPRYYDANTRLVNEMKTEKEKKESLEKRRKMLKELLEEEQKSYEIELMVNKNKKSSPRVKIDDIPTEVLKDLSSGIKSEQAERRKREAELALYHQWRMNNPILRDYERQHRTHDLKLSWLDQQIEKQMKKEKEEEEARRLQKELEERMKEDKRKEEEFKEYLEKRNKELKEAIENQMEELKERQRLSEELKNREAEEERNKRQLQEVEEQLKAMEKAKIDREIALYNIRQHKFKLKQKAKDIQDCLMEEEAMIRKLRDMDIAEQIENEQLKEEIKESLTEFLRIAREQKELEKIREKHMQLVFESEAKHVYEQQCQAWFEEEKARERLIKDVMKTLAEQIEEKNRKIKERQKELVLERETLIKMTEEYDSELKELQKQAEKQKAQRRKEMEKEIKLKSEIKKKELENEKLSRIAEELETARREEERLKRELLNLRKGQGACRPPRRSNIMF